MPTPARGPTATTSLKTWPRSISSDFSLQASTAILRRTGGAVVEPTPDITGGLRLGKRNANGRDEDRRRWSAPCGDARNPRGLAVFDLDGTLLRGPTVCEVLAASLGHGEEMQSFERLSTDNDHGIIRGRVEMARWYEAVSRERLIDFLTEAEWAPGVHAGVRRLQAAGVEVAIASITWKFAVDWFAAQVGVTRTLGTGLEDGGAITHVCPRDKAMWLRDMASSLNMPYEQTAAVGDSSGDLSMLAAAGLRFFLGPEAPPGLECMHIPGGDIDDVARRIIAEWEGHEGWAGRTL